MRQEPANPNLRDENPHQGASHSFGVPSTSSESTPRGATSDRERDLSSEREPGRAPSRRGAVTTPYSSYASPFAMMRRLAEDMDRFFDDMSSAGRGLTGRGMSRGFGAMGAGWAPAIETFRRGDRIVVRADLPGLRKDDLKVDIADGVLTIEGERNEEDHDESDGYYRTERSYGHFSRSIPLPEGTDEGTCEASFKDGVLEVSLAAPKAPERRARRIDIR